MIRVAVVALLLTTGVPSWVPGEETEPTIAISVQNWGTEVVLGEPGAVAFAHLAANGPTTHVTVTVSPGRDGLQGYVGRLTAPDAFGGELLLYCGDETGRTESAVVCGFDVPMSRGPNRVRFDLQSASFAGIRTAEAVVHGGVLEQLAFFEVQVGGSWVPVTGDTVRLPGGSTSALRYRLFNTGDIPFRATTSCQPDGTVWPSQQLVCPVRGPRPVYALMGGHTVAMRLEDPVGGGAAYSVAVEIEPAYRGGPAA